MKQKPRRKKSFLLRLLVLGVAVYFVTTLIGLSNDLAKASAEYAELEKQKHSLELTIKEYETLLDSDSHAAIIEKAARERLGFVYSDEEVYIDISGN
ncbi:MAG: septum formation initiator family protein [Clostridia bacterium]|nr:septum formation initiator family protein [Clostridia bacterium]